MKTKVLRNTDTGEIYLSYDQAAIRFKVSAVTIYNAIHKVYKNKFPLEYVSVKYLRTMVIK